AKSWQRGFLATIGTPGFLDGALSDQFHSADYSFAFAPNYRKGAGNQSRRGWIFFLFDLGRVRDRLVRLRLPSVPFESQNHHCGFQCGRWFGPPGNITDEKFMGDAHGTLWLGFRRRPLYPFGNRDHHGVDRAAALGESHRCARAGTQPGFFCRTLCRGIVLGLVNLARRPKCSWRCLLVASIAYFHFGRGGEFAGESPASNAFGLLIRSGSFWIMAVLFALGVSSTIGVYAMLPLYLVSERQI